MYKRERNRSKERETKEWEVKKNIKEKERESCWERNKVYKRDWEREKQKQGERNKNIRSKERYLRERKIE